MKVRLFRPFAATHFLQAIPPTVQRIAVLDRTKEPGSQGEPLLTEISTASQGRITRLPRICGGRYGLASREFTPAMVQAIFQELQNTPCKAEFTIGIRDDISHLSLPFDATLDIESADVRRALFYGLGADGTVSSNKNSIKILG